MHNQPRSGAPARRTVHSPFLVCVLLVLLVGPWGCAKGGGGGAPGTGTSTYRLVVGDELGVVDITSGGLDLAVAGVHRRVAVLSPDAVDVTSQAVLAVADPAVATLQGDRLSGATPGTTMLRASVAGVAVAAELRVRALEAVAIEDFDFASTDEVVLHSTAPRQLATTGRLASGDIVPVDARCTWRTLDASVVSVGAAGEVQAVGDGSTFVVAEEPQSGIERSLRVHVALPRPSGSVLDGRGGRVESGNTALWVPPFSLGAAVPVSIQELDAGALPAPLPPGEQLIAAVGVAMAQPFEFSPGATVEVRTTTDALGTLARVLVFDPTSTTWRHFAWVTIGQLGLIEWITAFPSVFAIVEAPGAAAAFAAQHAPTFVLANTDLAPISLEFLLTQCDLREEAFGFDPIVSAAPTANALLTTYTSADHYLALDDVGSAGLATGSDWGAASAGGVRSAGLQPTVYWSVRTEQRRGTPPLPYTQHYVVVQYWLLYAGSSLPIESSLGNYLLWHDGDVEFCQVLLDGQKDPPEPIAATASQHYYGEARPWADVMTDGDRAMFWVAKGSHATHFERGFGGGNRHRTTSGNRGFVRKAIPDALDLAQTADRCAATGEEVLLRAADYALVDLDDGSPSSRVLRDWAGTFGRGGAGRQVGTVRSRNPKEPALAMYEHGLDFHFAYPFATSTAIRAYDAIDPAGLSAWVRIGRRMVDLQQQTAATWPGEPVSARVDTACGPQPEHLVDYLQAGGGYPPNKYYACSEWRLLEVSPSGPVTAQVGEPLQLTVSWAGFETATLGAIAYPLRVILLPAVDEGYPANIFGTYPGAAGPVNFGVAPTGLVIVSAPAGTTSVPVEIEWSYSENGVQVPIPAAATASTAATTQWRFHVFVRDAANTTLYHSNSLVVGPYSFERDGPPVDVTLTLGAASGG